MSRKRPQTRRDWVPRKLLVCLGTKTAYPSGGDHTNRNISGRRDSRNHMTIVDRAALRRWARRSLLLAALLAAPAAYSEVAADSPDEDPGTLLGNYLSGRIGCRAHRNLAPPRFFFQG